MVRNRLALVTEDPHLAEAIQSRLGGRKGSAALVCSFESIRDHLDRDGNGLLLLAAASPAGSEQIVRLVQEVSLEDLRVPMLVIESEPAARQKDLRVLEPYVAGRFRWPDQADALVRQVGECAPRTPGFSPSPGGPPGERIVRELRRYTPSLVPLAEPLALAAAHDVTVLLTGETGTGKTHLARLIHNCSARKDHRLLVVPCGALSANLIESELFGHARGAFTGADRAKVGKFEAVGGGTLLLDEIDTLGLEQQAKLLRIIETGEYEPVGSNETRVCHARLIAASNWNLEEAVAEGRFRQDLYYRLHVLGFYLPPLRERVQDIAALARGMAARFAGKFGKGLFAISPDALEALQAFPWPGNVRQLENVVQQAVLVGTGPELLPEHLPAMLQEHAPGARGAEPAPAQTLVHNREQHERAAILRALEEAGHSRTRAAQALGISRVTLYKKMKKYGLLEVPSFPGTA